MPNWCSNIIILDTEDKTEQEVCNTMKDIKALTDNKSEEIFDFSEETFDFNKIIPIPDEISDENKTGTFTDLEFVDILQSECINNIKLQDQLHDNTCPVENHTGFVDNNGINDWYLDMAKVHHDHSKYLIDKYGVSSAYEYRCSAWGTKWEGSELHVRRDGFNIIINFETAWSPPVPIYYKLCETIFKDYKSDFRFYEPGCEVLGHLYFDKEYVRLNDHIYYDDNGISDESFKELTDFWGVEPDEYTQDEKTGLWSYDPEYEY